jgi:hypothetical protein
MFFDQHCQPAVKMPDAVPDGKLQVRDQLVDPLEKHQVADTFIMAYFNDPKEH